MKKILLIGCLILTCACQTTTPTPEPSFSPTETPLPTPIPDTATPEPTLTPDPSPTPLPRFFTTQFDSSLAGWVLLQAGNESIPNVTAIGGKLAMQMDLPYTWLYALYGAQEYVDATLETAFVNNASSPASIGLICRYNEASGWFEYNVTTDGTYNVLFGQWLAVGVLDYVPVVDGSLPSPIPTGETHTIGLSCIGTTLQLYINETVIRSIDVSRFALGSGKVGLTVAAFENIPVGVTFESITVREP